ncbi:MAG: lipoyl(octanoyl) transferase LipB [Bacteroidetes bacterium]|nr:lipoyl(octanoyl) transferase LipB [Bacteroidota bacterium]MBU1718403.1 lipoyl(octanoyl) transferase LipB [Bacteroidota bacterium]
MKKLQFRDIGQMEYLEAKALQEEYHAKVLAEESGFEHGIFLFCSHPHVLTSGISGKDGNLLVSDEILRAKGVSQVKTNRGGDITYHGPGQIVGYPIIPLSKYGLGVKSYVDLLEELIIRSIASFNIRCERLTGATGVWIRDGAGDRKICAMGIRVSRAITMHGFALNVNTDLSYFRLINPCGYTDKGVTSISKEAGYRISEKEVLEVLINNFRELTDSN